MSEEKLKVKNTTWDDIGTFLLNALVVASIASLVGVIMFKIGKGIAAGIEKDLIREQRITSLLNEWDGLYRLEMDGEGRMVAKDSGEVYRLGSYRVFAADPELTEVK